MTTCDCTTILCAECHQSFLDILEDIPDRLATMTVSITKQAVMGGQGGKPTNDDDRPLPVNLGAADARIELRAQLVNTALRVKHCLTERPQAKTIGEVCAWLRRLMPRMVNHPECINWYQGIATAYQHTTKLIDRPPERIRAGVCDCGETIYTFAGNNNHAECRKCGSMHDVWSLQQAEIDKVQAYTGTAAEVLRVLAHADIKIRLTRLTKWADRGHVNFTTIDGARHFTVGDVHETYLRMERTKTPA